MQRFIVLGTRSWNREVFDRDLATLPGEWHYIDDPAALTVDAVRAIAPRYLFFLHWSWRVPAEIFEPCECVCFHLGALPYGRGGSPLQNLIVRGHRETLLTALRMVEGLDAGPIYTQRPIALTGTAGEILSRASVLSVEMIRAIVEQMPVPVPQQGEPVVFTRRTPAESVLPAGADLQALYDHIRMLDGEGYPPAFVDVAGFRFEFTDADLADGRVRASVSITKR